VLRDPAEQPFAELELLPGVWCIGAPARALATSRVRAGSSSRTLTRGVSRSSAA